VFSFILAIQGVASTNTLPVAIGGTVGVDSNAVITTPAGFVSSNGFSQVNPAVLLYDESFDGWGTLDGSTWTNSSGWTSTAEVTNGICNLATQSLLSPWITGRGIEAITVTWSNLAFFTSTVNYSTNDVDWIALTALADLRIAATGYRLRFTAVSSLPPPGSDPIALLDRLVIWGHRFPTRIGGTNDFAGIVFRVDNPVGNRDAVNLQTLESRLSAYIMGGHSAEGWSQFSASNDVDLAGHALKLDPRYTLSVVGDAVTLSMGGSTVFEIVGANTCTPRIVSFQVSGTNRTADVIGVTGWRPYPQWSTNLTDGSWTTLTTNQFTSTFPDITNGAFRLTWSSGESPFEYWRIFAVDETGGTNGPGLATFHIPVSVPALFVGGREVSPYSPSWVSNADYAVSAGMAATSTISGYAETAGSSQMSTMSLTSAHATIADSASVATYANDAAHAARSDSSSTSAYSTNSRTSATSAYATNSGYATSAGYASSAPGQLPVGSIIQFGGTNLPQGFLLCDGSSVSTNIYADLYAAIGKQWGGSGTNFNVPDLRGQFLRGWSGTATNSVDPDVYSRTARYSGGSTSNNVGSYQSDTNQAHSHLYTAGQQSTWTFSNGSPYSPAYSTANSATTSSGGSESRPKNVYVMYCIKY
jgi:microcystin-dependent protein